MERITVYALRFAEGTIYVGLTNNLRRRLEEHQRRQSPSTKRIQGSFRLIYQKEFAGYREARRHEKYLKSGSGRKMLQDES